MARSSSVSLSFAVLAFTSLACMPGAAPSAAAPRATRFVTTAPALGTAESFSVLGATTVTNIGPSVLNLDLGVSAGTAVTGFPPGLLTPPSTIHAGDAIAAQAQNDVVSAGTVLAGDPCAADLSGQDLGGMTLAPGVYCFTSSAQLTGTLVLDAQLTANAAFIFKIGSTLTTASGASVRLINGATSCNTFWQVGSSATFGTATSFAGSVLATASITLQTGASLDGRAFAETGAVTLDSNAITSGVCVATVVGDAGPGDAGQPDAGAVDAGPAADGGASADAGPPDAGGGQAELTCCAGAVDCDGTCSDLNTDANHCGACGHSCRADEVCAGGACTACPATRTQCTEQCADLTSDPFNCGACGTVCAASQSCLSGTCSGCDGTLCSNTCVDLSNDRTNCGVCGNACATGECCNAGVCSTSGASGSCSVH
jgi:hypothetical protein